MKRIAFIVVMVLMSMGASARTIHYFTYSQASRTVNFLNTQNEIMIYCGYEYEIETYVLVNEVWMERVNSSYYELWIYGFDAYTGDEIYMPLDLQCVWLYSAGRMYNAAQYLRFRVDVRTPSISWRIPPYRPFTRSIHRSGYTRSYHYDIHRYGWMPPAYSYGPGMPPPPLPHYYMRSPNTPAPMPSAQWTPGVERPVVAAPSAPSSGTTTVTPTSYNPNRESNSSTSRNANSQPAASSSQRTAGGNTTSSTPTRSAGNSQQSTGSSQRTAGGSTTSASPTRSAGSSQQSSVSGQRAAGSSSTSSTPTRGAGNGTTETTRRGGSTSTTPTAATPTRNSTTSAANPSTSRSGNSTATTSRSAGNANATRGTSTSSTRKNATNTSRSGSSTSATRNGSGTTTRNAGSQRTR